MDTFIIKNALVIDTFNKTEKTRDLLVENGRITQSLSSPPDFTIDASGLTAVPGLVDMHTHFRDPGFTHKEDIISGAEAAACGGITTAACMPNTKPCVDTPDMVRYVVEKAKNAKIHVLPIAAVTFGQQGKTLTDFRALREAGAVALSDDGNPITSAAVMRDALFRAKELDMLVISHCEDAEMVANHAVNEGIVSRRLNIPGRPAIAEELMIMRDIMLAKETGARLHIAHVSTQGSVAIIRRAKNDGVNVTCETCPHYFTLTENEILRQGTLARVNPPLRTQDDVEAIINGLRDGTIDVIATDHAPHAPSEKALPLAEAPSGMIGLETSLALALTVLVYEKSLTITDILCKMSYAPAQILNINAGAFRVNTPADITLFDSGELWTVNEDSFKSKSRNSPFIGKTLRGRVKKVFADGKQVFGG